MLLISFFDGYTLDSRQELVVAKSLNQEDLYTFSGGVLRCVPSKLVMSKLYTEGADDFDSLPLVTQWVEEHIAEVEDCDFSLRDLELNVH